MSEPARLVETQGSDDQQYADDLKACEAIVEEIEAAEREYRAGNPIAARMHLFDAAGKARALATGEGI